MFGRLLIKSLTRRLSRKLLAVLAVWLGISLVVGLLTLTLDAGDKLNRELHAFGANIELLPAAAALPVRVGGHELAPGVDTAYLDEQKLAALKSIFWANNILAITPRLDVRQNGFSLIGLPLRPLPAHWKLTGAIPRTDHECLVGVDLARARGLAVGAILLGEELAGRALPHEPFTVSGIVATGGVEDNAVIAGLATVQRLTGLAGPVSTVAISALTTPENKLADKYRLDPRALTPTEYERWYRTPYPGGVAANIQAAIPGSVARVVRRSPSRKALC